MIFLWKIVRTLMAIIGIVLIFGAAGTSDYYVLELGQSEPSSVWITLTIGLLMIVPLVFHIIKERIQDDVQNG